MFFLQHRQARWVYYVTSLLIFYQRRLCHSLQGPERCWAIQQQRKGLLFIQPRIAMNVQVSMPDKPALSRKSRCQMSILPLGSSPFIPVALSLTTRKTTAKQPDDEADHKACFHIFDHKTDRYPKYYQEPDAYPSPPAFLFPSSFIYFWQPNQVSKSL